jgi:hypothetical protein
MLVILATWEADIRRIDVGGQPGQGVCEISILTHSWVLVVCTCHISAMAVSIK